MRAAWTTAGAADVRIGDAERERAANLLNRHFAEGRLTPLEHAERTELALASRTAGDLDALFADLPSLEEDQPRSPVGRMTRILRRPTRVLAAAVLAAAALFVLAHMLPLVAVVLLVLLLFRTVVRPGGRHWHRLGPVVPRRW